MTRSLAEEEEDDVLKLTRALLWSEKKRNHIQCCLYRTRRRVMQQSPKKKEDKCCWSLRHIWLRWSPLEGGICRSCCWVSSSVWQWYMVTVRKEWGKSLHDLDKVLGDKLFVWWESAMMNCLYSAGQGVRGQCPRKTKLSHEDKQCY